jgi:hypothetical protein
MDGVMMGIYEVCNTMLTVGMTGADRAGAGVTQETPGLGGVPRLDIRISPTYSPKIKRVIRRICCH